MGVSFVNPLPDCLRHFELSIGKARLII